MDHNQHVQYLHQGITIYHQESASTSKDSVSGLVSTALISGIIMHGNLHTVLSSSDCTSALDQCGQFWICQSHYDYQNDQSCPPHTCPFPGPGFTLPPQPGPCQYNLSSQMCQYFTNSECTYSYLHTV